jgi:hypothetical protein
MDNQITIVIATALKRTHWLLTRSIPSVYTQKNIEAQRVNLIIVDDNDFEKDGYSKEFEAIKQGVQILRSEMNIPEKHFRTEVINNQRTKGNSGTGAWNTGIYKAFQDYPNGYVSILDDDDEYLPNHLSDCDEILKTDDNIIAVFQRMQWYNEDNSTMDLPLSIDLLKVESFYVGNPGVQGSNMFFKTKFLIDIGAFDEQFPNTTDRDLMIRFLWHFENLNQKFPNQYKLAVLENLGVIHHNHSAPKVNTNLVLKQKGLDLFYKKYKSFFSEEDYQKSIARAKAFFNYQPSLKE